MKTVTLLICSFLLIAISSPVSAQARYWARYDGIPVIAFPNANSQDIARSPQLLQRMKEIGIYGFHAYSLSQGAYDTIKSYDLKMFPLRLWGGNNALVYYTSGIYNIWEAEGKGDGSMGDAEIIFNDNIGEVALDGNSVITKTNAQAGDLIYGPYYYQYVKYKMYDTGDPIEYTAKFRLKIDSIGLPPANIDSIEVCTLKICATKIENGYERNIVEPRVLKVIDFKNDTTGQIWDYWKYQTFNYNLGDLLNLTEDELRFPQLTLTEEFTSEFMQYKVIWNGLSFLKLSVDKITIYDEDRGFRLFNDSVARDSIISNASEFTDTNYVLGLHGMGEPFSMDN